MGGGGGGRERQEVLIELLEERKDLQGAPAGEGRLQDIVVRWGQRLALSPRRGATLAELGVRGSGRGWKLSPAAAPQRPADTHPLPASPSQTRRGCTARPGPG